MLVEIKILDNQHATCECGARELTQTRRRHNFKKGYIYDFKKKMRTGSIRGWPWLSRPANSTRRRLRFINSIEALCILSAADVYWIRVSSSCWMKRRRKKCNCRRYDGRTRSLAMTITYSNQQQNEEDEYLCIYGAVYANKKQKQHTGGRKWEVKRLLWLLQVLVNIAEKIVCIQFSFVAYFSFADLCI